MSSDQSARPPDSDRDDQILTVERPKAKRPPMYRVVLLNDDFTPMDFVVLVLKKFFNKTDASATAVMFEVHEKGAGLAGVYTFEVAETKVHAVNEFSRRHRHPLKCIMEKE